MMNPIGAITRCSDSVGTSAGSAGGNTWDAEWNAITSAKCATPDSPSPSATCRNRCRYIHTACHSSDSGGPSLGTAASRPANRSTRACGSAPSSRNAAAPATDAAAVTLTIHWRSGFPVSRGSSRDQAIEPASAVNRISP
jgi:hypothetical protein